MAIGVAGYGIDLFYAEFGDNAGDNVWVWNSIPRSDVMVVYLKVEKRLHSAEEYIRGLCAGVDSIEGEGGDAEVFADWNHPMIFD